MSVVRHLLLWLTKHSWTSIHCNASLSWHSTNLYHAWTLALMIGHDLNVISMVNQVIRCRVSKAIQPISFLMGQSASTALNLFLILTYHPFHEWNCLTALWHMNLTAVFVPFGLHSRPGCPEDPCLYHSNGTNC
jgi:hypothetical protein